MICSVYMDGMYLGDNLPLISDVSRIAHVIELKSEFFTGRVVKNIVFKKSNQLIILKLLQEGDKYYLNEVTEAD